MTATLYQPGQPPQPLPPEQFRLPDASGRARVTQTVADALGCAVGLVDVSASGPGYVAYSIFDCEEEINESATVQLMDLTEIEFDMEKDNDILRGNVLIIFKERFQVAYPLDTI